MRPVLPSYMTSLPDLQKPFLTRPSRMDSSFSPEKAVPSMMRPSMDPTFPAIISSTCPMVIREGIPWGLTTRSGVTPSAVKGMSHWSTSLPTTPFCPNLEQNLSPSSGILSSLTLTRTSLEPFSDSVIMTESTYPFSPGLTVTEVSLLFWGVRKSVSSSRNLGGDVFPMRTSDPWTSLSGEMSPSSPRDAYARSARAPMMSGEGISKWSSCPPG